jgi:hypothetical protein
MYLFPLSSPPYLTSATLLLFTMHIPLLLLPILTALTQASPIISRSSSWPHAPFTTSGRDIKNSLNNTVTYAGVNWPGAADVMIPEGLQYQSIATIVSKIKDLDMNVIRLTYAIEMIDDIYDGVDSSLKTAFINALGEVNGTKVLEQVLSSNPTFTENTTRLEVSPPKPHQHRSLTMYNTGLQRNRRRSQYPKHLHPP